MKLEIINGVPVYTNNELVNNSTNINQEYVGENADKDFSLSASTAFNESYSVDDKFVELAQKYEFGLNRNDTLESIKRKAAENQSGLEQFGRMLGQMVVNEIALGAVLGFSDIADWMINIGKAYGEDDWTNPISSKLTEWQDALKEQWEIYRKNPEKSWNITSL